jgi:hypothetical protein
VTDPLGRVRRCLTPTARLRAIEDALARDDRDDALELVAGVRDGVAVCGRCAAREEQERLGAPLSDEDRASAIVTFMLPDDYLGPAPRVTMDQLVAHMAALADCVAQRPLP